MYQNVVLELERDQFSRVVKRMEIVDDETTISIYDYNEYGDLSGVKVYKNEMLIQYQLYRYEYDVYKNKTMKFWEFHLTKEYLRELPNFQYTPSISACHYINQYEEGRLVKKSCLQEGNMMYWTHYYYDNNKLIRIERFNKNNEKVYWCKELLEYKENKIIKSVWMPNGILSHYCTYTLKDGVAINQQFISPVKGSFDWRITSYDNTSCSIYVGVTYLTAEILLEIVAYIDDTRNKNNEYILLIIECADTVVYTSDQSLMDIVDDARVRGIGIQFLP